VVALGEGWSSGERAGPRRDRQVDRGYLRSVGGTRAALCGLLEGAALRVRDGECVARAVSQRLSWPTRDSVAAVKSERADHSIGEAWWAAGGAVVLETTSPSTEEVVGASPSRPSTRLARPSPQRVRPSTAVSGRAGLTADGLTSGRPLWQLNVDDDDAGVDSPVFGYGRPSNASTLRRQWGAGPTEQCVSAGACVAPVLVCHLLVDLRGLQGSAGSSLHSGPDGGSDACRRAGSMLADRQP
jgi:hypothetical protein